MADIETILTHFEMRIKRELHTLVNIETTKPTVVHNHPPVPFIVNNCPYCKKHGNCFYKN